VTTRDSSEPSEEIQNFARHLTNRPEDLVTMRTLLNLRPSDALKVASLAELLAASQPKSEPIQSDETQDTDDSPNEDDSPPAKQEDEPDSDGDPDDSSQDDSVEPSTDEAQQQPDEPHNDSSDSSDDDASSGNSDEASITDKARGWFDKASDTVHRAVRGTNEEK